GVLVDAALIRDACYQAAAEEVGAEDRAFGQAVEERALDGVGAVVVDDDEPIAGVEDHRPEGGEVQRGVVDGDAAGDVDLVETDGVGNLDVEGQARLQVQVAGVEDAGTAAGRHAAAVDRDGAADRTRTAEHAAVHPHRAAAGAGAGRVVDEQCPRDE